MATMRCLIVLLACAALASAGRHLPGSPIVKVKTSCGHLRIKSASNGEICATLSAKNHRHISASTWVAVVNLEGMRATTEPAGSGFSTPVRRAGGNITSIVSLHDDPSMCNLKLNVCFPPPCASTPDHLRAQAGENSWTLLPQTPSAGHVAHGAKVSATVCGFTDDIEEFAASFEVHFLYNGLNPPHVIHLDDHSTCPFVSGVRPHPDVPVPSPAY